MTKSAKQMAYEAMIVDLFQKNQYSRRAVLKTLLSSYIPAPSTGIFAPATNLFKSLTYIRRHQTELVTDMLKIVNAPVATDTESKSNGNTSLPELTPSELTTLFDLLNNSQTKNITAAGDFVELMKAYFHFFPEDRHLVNANSPFDAYFTSTGFDADYFERYLKQFKDDPCAFVRDNDDKALLSSMIESFLPELTDADARIITQTLISTAESNALPTNLTIYNALDKLVEHPSSLVKSDIRDHLVKIFFPNDQQEEKLEKKKLIMSDYWLLPNIVAKSFINMENDEATKNNRSTLINTILEWLKIYAVEDDIVITQFSRQPLYFINALIPCTTEEEINLLANAIVPLVKIARPDLSPAMALTDGAFPNSSNLGERPLFKLFIEIAAKATGIAASNIQTTLSNLPNYGKGITTFTRDKYSSEQTVGGFMLQAMATKTRPNLIQRHDKSTPASAELLKKLNEEKMESADDHLDIILKQHSDPAYDFKSASLLEIFAHYDKEKIIQTQKDYSVQQYLRFANFLPPAVLADHMRKIFSLPKDANAIKAQLMVKLHSILKKNQTSTVAQPTVRIPAL